MKIGFLSLLNPFDIRYWSGTLYHFTQKLSNHQLDWYGEGIFEQLCSYRSLSSKPFCLEHYSVFLGSILSERLKNIDADVLIVRDNSLVASLKVSCPIVFLGDATINGMKEYFDISKDEDIELVDRVEKQFLLKRQL